MAQVRKKLAPPLVGSDILLVVRPKQNINQVLDVTYDELISALKTVFPTTSGGVSSVNGQTGVVILALDDLSDVNAGSPTSGQVLQWNGTEWVASTIGTAAWGSIGTGTGVASQTDLVSYLTSNYVPIARNLTINGVTYDLSADRSWTIAAGVTSVGATAPITSSGGSTPTISTSMNTNKLIGRGTAGVGVMEEITLGTNLSLSGTTLNATGGSGIPKGTASGTDTYTTTISGVTSYNDGDAYLIRFTNGNTTGCTLNINSLGAITLYRNNDGPLIGGDILDGAEMLCVYNSTTNRFQVIGTSPNTLLSYVTNDDTVTLTKGMAVFAFGGTGDRMTVQRASNLSDSTSAQTVGLVLSSSIAPNQKGIIMMQGLLDGLNILPTATWNDGDPVFLGDTPGSITKTKPYAPKHLVYLGVVTTANNGFAGRMYVKVQNGYELDELHNVQAQSPTYKDTLWYDNTVSPAQWKTASIATILGYTPGSVTSVSATVPSPTSPALSVNVSNPTTTPAIAITANGTTSQYVRGDGSLAAFPSVLLQSGRFAWMTQLFEHTAGLINGIEYVAAYNKIFVAAGGNNVLIFEATTGEFLASISVTAALRVRYISSINEVWCTSSSVASITRISPVSNTSLGTITTSVLANGWEILEYSSTKVFITIVAGGASILVVNPSTLAVTATITTNVPSFASGMALNNNVSSAQYDRIVVTGNTGVAILNPSTNSISTSVANPSSSISLGREIVYTSSDDKYYLASQVNNRIICLNIASATTFTLNKIKYNAYQSVSLQVDDANDLIIFNQIATSSGTNLDTMCNFIQKSTFDSYTNIIVPSFGGAGSLAGYIKLDTTNKRAFIAGTASASRSITTVRYL